MELFEKIYQILTNVGIDIIIIIAIVVITQGLKKKFKLKSKTAFIIVLVLGLSVSMSKIFLFSIESDQYLTVIFGYPGLSVLLYDAICIFIPYLKDKLKSK